MNNQFFEIYHKKQMSTPYRSTEVFVEWLERLDVINPSKPQKVLDMACGGANAAYISRRHPELLVEGNDIDSELVEWGNGYIKDNYPDISCRLYQGNWFEVREEDIDKYDGIVSFQTLMMFENYIDAVKCLTKRNPKWIALISLFYEGEIDYINKFYDYYRKGEGGECFECYYNIYSLPRMKALFEELGYTQFEYMPFEIDIDLPKPEHKDMGTYTVKTEDGHRLQISGAMLMPWYFIIAKK